MNVRHQLTKNYGLNVMMKNCLWLKVKQKIKIKD